MAQFPRFPLSSRRRKVSQRDLFQSFRRALVVGLAALLFSAPLSFSASAQNGSSSSKSTDRDYYVVYQDANGDAVCRTATPAEQRQLREINPATRGMHQINHLKGSYDDFAHSTNAQGGDNDLPAHLTIILRATTQLEQNPPAKAAFIRAAATWESQIKSPVTIYLDADFGSTNFGTPWGSNTLGSTSSPSISSAAYQSVRNNLLAGASNATEASIYNALPTTSVPTDQGDVNTASVSSSIARAIGMLDPTAQSTDSAARIGFNSAFNFDFNSSDGISPGMTDFEAVATHEIGHALGFTSRSGTGSATPTIWDLFRFRTGTTAATFTTAPRIMTIGGSPDPLQFYFVPGSPELGLSNGGPSGSTTNGADGWQSSHWKHASGCTNSSYIGIMDPAIPSGCRRTITSNDTNTLNILGYNLDNSNPPPPPPPPPPAPANDNFANAQVITGCSGSTTGTNVGATHETGEPSHDPAGNAGASSVWYQWQAPSSGSVTITTAGSNYDTMLGVYTGTAVNSLTPIAKNDDVDTQGGNVTSSVTFNATAGTTYRIAVDGWGGDAGNIKLNWTASNCSQVKADQTITFNALSNKTFGDPAFTVSASATSGLPVSFSILSGPATISGNTVTITGTGTVTVRASQAGDANFNAAPDVNQSFIVNKAQATITLGNLSQIYDGSAKSATATTNPLGLSGVSISYSQNGTAVTSPTNAGSYAVTASLNNSNYQAANASGTLIISKANQTINFGTLTNKTYGDPLFNVSATSSSNLPVSFAIFSGPATISGNTVNITGAGTVVVRASQSGNSNYNAASSVDQTFTVAKAGQTINFGALPSRTFGDAPFTLGATSSSGLPVSFQILSGPATINGNTVSITGTGDVTVRATQAGNGNYNAATPVDRAFNVVSANGNISLASLVHTYDGTAKLATATTNPAGLNVNFSYSQNGSPVTSPINAGAYNVTATINDPNFQGTTTGTLVINKATPVITWNNPANIIFGTALSGTQLNATTNVPGTFLYNALAGTVLSVGTYQLSVVFIPNDAANYNTASASVQLTVDAPPSPTLTFSSATYTVAEGQSFANITVTRTGDLSGSSTVKYATSDSTDVNFQCNPNTAGQITGVASRKCDYHIAVGRLRFAPNESSKQIKISIVDDAYVEGSETFSLTLSNPVGAVLGANTSATVTITDNDAAGQANPIDNTRFYVRQLYVDLLSREPDQAGWDGWTSRIDLCGQPGQAPPPCDRVTVGGDGFLRSSEFFDRQFFVLRLYRTGLGRIPNYSEVGDLASVSGFLSSTDLELNKQDLVAEIMARPEFGNRYNGLTDPSAYINALEQTAGVTLSNKQQLVTDLSNNTKTRAQIYREISERAEVSNKYLHEAQVISCYYGFFTRNPDGAYLNFLDRLDRGEITLGDLANAFINAAEYRQRFGQ